MDKQNKTSIGGYEKVKISDIAKKTLKFIK